MNDKYTQKAVFTNRREVALLNVLLVKQKTEEKKWLHMQKLIYIYTVVSRKYAPPFALVQNAGGAYTRDATFSLAIMPSRLVP